MEKWEKTVLEIVKNMVLGHCGRVEIAPTWRTFDRFEDHTHLSLIERGADGETQRSFFVSLTTGSRE